MDRWITAIKADTRDIPQIDKVVQNKPADLQEGCYTKDAAPAFIAETQVRETERTTACNTLYPTNSFPREVAGADVAAEMIKCQRPTPHPHATPAAVSSPGTNAESHGPPAARTRAASAS